MRIVTFIMIVFLFMGCSDKEGLLIVNHENDFDIEEHFSSEVLSLEGLLKINNFLVIDSFLITNNIREDSIFIAYNLNSRECTKAWGIKGRGPDEFGAFTFLYSIGNNRFQIADYSNMRIYTYELPDFRLYEVQIIDFGEYKSSIREIPQDIETKNGTDFFYLNLATNILSITKWEKGYPPNRIFTFDFFGDKYQTPYPYFGCMTLDGGTGRIAYAYNYMRRFDIFDSDGAILRRVTINPCNTEPVEKRGEFDIINSRMYYKAIRTADDLIYLLFIGASGKELMLDPENNVSYIEVYDWSGKAVKRIKLDKFIIDFDVIWRGNEIFSIIGVDPLNSNPLLHFKPGT